MNRIFVDWASSVGFRYPDTVALEQFFDDEYECDYKNHPASSSVANVDEWKWKLNLLLRNEKDQEIVSRDKRDRRDYEQISNLAKRMGLYSEIYGKVVVVSKVPLPNYRPDLDDKRPQREVVIPLSLQRRVEGLLQEHIDRRQFSIGKADNILDGTKSFDKDTDANMETVNNSGKIQTNPLESEKEIACPHEDQHILGSLVDHISWALGKHHNFPTSG